MILGIDFDNTIIQYDVLFHRVAFEEGHIEENLPKEKNAVRDYLRQHGKEDVWTTMQGEVYGNRILEAEAFTGVLCALGELNRLGISTYIVSHKTKTPFLGPPYDLHKSAMAWLSANGFFDPQVLGWTEDQVYFEQTKEAKVQRICSLGCTHYIDDLPEILNIIPDNIVKIYFCPGQFHQRTEWNTLLAWDDFPSLLKRIEG
jgi:hypothetical protein